MPEYRSPRDEAWAASTGSETERRIMECIPCPLAGSGVGLRGTPWKVTIDPRVPMVPGGFGGQVLDKHGKPALGAEGRPLGGGSIGKRRAPIFGPDGRPVLGANGKRENVLPVDCGSTERWRDPPVASWILPVTPRMDLTVCDW